MSGPVTGRRALTARQIAGYARAAGFRGEALVTAVAVALAESGGQPEAHNENRNGSRDRGLWQINTVHGGSDRALFNPATNAAYAWRISSGGKNWSPWVAWKTGAYSAFLPAAQAAVGEVGTGGAQLVGAGGVPDIVGGAGDVVDGVIDGATGFVTDALSDTARAVMEALMPIALASVFTVAALGLIALGLARLTERTPDELFSTATKFTGAGGIAKAVI